jgi:GDP-D-mannose dehydratase
MTTGVTGQAGSYLAEIGDSQEIWWIPRIVLLNMINPKIWLLGKMNHSVREFCAKAFTYLDLYYKEYVFQGPRFYRPAKVDRLVADSRRVRQTLGYAPKVDFDGLVRLMVHFDRVHLGKEIT